MGSKLKLKKSYLIISLIILSVLAFNLYFAPKGLRDWFHLKAEINDTELHIRQLENSNQELRRKVDLIRENSMSVKEDQIRESLGLVRKDELIYFTGP